MKIIGETRSNFTGKDGTEIQGQNFYATYPLSGSCSQGPGCEKFYITDIRLAQGGYDPKVSDEVTLMYTKNGKVAAILPVKA